MTLKKCLILAGILTVGGIIYGIPTYRLWTREVAMSNAESARIEAKKLAASTKDEIGMITYCQPGGSDLYERIVIIFPTVEAQKQHYTSQARSLKKVKLSRIPPIKESSGGIYAGEFVRLRFNDPLKGSPVNESSPQEITNYLQIHIVDSPILEVIRLQKEVIELIDDREHYKKLWEFLMSR